MITQIRLINFEAHRDTTIDLTNGMNVLMGSSFSNKSGVIKGLNWVLKNRPRGDVFKSNFAKKKDPVSVTITLSCGTVITREKKGTDNLYIVSTLPKPLKALGTDVPDEVTEILRMDDINLQSQGAGYFMIGDKPGVRAKTINKVVGLSIIDRTTRAISSVVKTENSRLKVVNEELEKNKTKLAEYEGLNDLNAHAKRVGNLYGELSRIKTERSTLIDIVETIEEKEQVVTDATLWLEVEDDFKECEAILDKIKGIRLEAFKIQEIINNYDAQQTKIDDAVDFLHVEKDVESIEKHLKRLKEIKQEKSGLEQLVENIEIVRDNIRLANIDIHDLGEELNEIDTCPTCGTINPDWGQLI